MKKEEIMREEETVSSINQKITNQIFDMQETEIPHIHMIMNRGSYLVLKREISVNCVTVRRKSLKGNLGE